MDLAELRIQNFGAIKETHLYLENKGLVSVHGINLDPTGSNSNGSGKSTIINAILWGCYGDAGKSSSADGIVNKQIGKDCFVETLWKDQDVWYLISRYRKHKVFKNAITVQTSHDKGTSWKDQTKAGKLVQEQINEILGCDQKTFEAYCFARQDDAPDIPKMTDKELKSLLERTLPFERLDECYKVASKNYNDAKRDYEALERRLADVTNQGEFVKEQGKKAVENKNNYADEVAVFNSNIDRQITEIEDFIASNTIRDIDKLNTEASEWQEVVDSIDLADYYSALNKSEQILESLTETGIEISKLKKDASCYVCGTELNDPTEIINRLKQEQDRLYKEHKANELKVDSLRILFKRKGEAEVKVKELNAEVSAAFADNKRVERQKARIRELEASKKDATLNPYIAQIKDMSDKWTELKQKKTELEAELTVAARSLKVKEATAKLYSPTGIRYHLLETVTPYLNERTNYYLNQLTDGAIKAIWSTVTKLASGEYREKFSIEISMGKIDEYGLLSGGEKRKVKLACFFALQDLIASRATKNINIYCGDEIDHALDPAGLERLMCLLNEKTKVKSTILVISHNELREWIPNCATITRQNNISSVTGFLNG